VANGKTCEVWDTIHERNATRHALKALAPSSRGDRKQTGILKREYTIGAQLKHGAIIRTDEFGVDEGVAYLAMEFFPAATMKQRIHQGDALIERCAQQIIEQSCEALGYLHALNWVHRDVKPDNFLVDDTGDVKLIDFSLARKVSPVWLQWLPAGSSIEGTQSYISPEQIRCRRPDVRADIYSLGCVIFELTCGRPPFSGETTNALLTKHLRTTPPTLKSQNPRICSGFAELVQRMLAKQPAERPPRVEDVLKEVRAVGVFDVARRAVRGNQNT